MLVTYDPEANATYVSLSDAPVAETVQLRDSVSVDLDESGEPVGVELLMAPAAATDDVLALAIDRYPNLSNVANALRQIGLPATA